MRINKPEFDIFRDYAGEIPGIMKAIIFFAILAVAATNATKKYCYLDVVQACTPGKATILEKPICSARYGAIDKVEKDMQRYVNSHITRSFEYLMMSTHYANYEKNREGFEKFFRDLSDSTWNKAIDLIKHLTKRGGVMNFENQPDPVNSAADVRESYELHELQSLAKALDITKHLAEEAFNIHNEATRRHKDEHDPEVSSYMEEEFMHKHSDMIRKISGYTTDLTSLLSGPDSSLALFMFDEYLKKQ